jgi:tartrate dehydrogenase/decarboxylase/D-malate dehydrogenase
MKTYSIAAIPGDGIGTEVVAAGLEAMAAIAKRDGGFAFKVDQFDWGGEYYKKHGRMMPENGRDLIRKHDAILFGSAGHPEIPDHITLWGLRLAICQPFDQYANVRPTRVLPGITSPLRNVNGGELDWVIVRENSEGEYAGVGGRVHQGSPLEAATDVAMFTRAGVERIMRFAFRLAQSRPRKLLTVVTKSNAQRHAMVMWDEIAVEIAGEFKDVTWDKMLVDAMTMRMVMRPETIDTVVATNLHADILSDLAAALAGSLGIAPTANLNPERSFPSMFEPIHGSAFDIMGKGVANPIGTFWSAVMMLEHLGEKDAAGRLMKAIERVTADKRFHTPDLGGKARTADVTAAVVDAIQKSRGLDCRLRPPHCRGSSRPRGADSRWRAPPTPKPSARLLRTYAWRLRRLQPRRGPRQSCSFPLRHFQHYWKYPNLPHSVPRSTLRRPMHMC